MLARNVFNVPPNAPIAVLLPQICSWCIPGMFCVKRPNASSRRRLGAAGEFGGVEGGVLLAALSLAREGDEVVGDEADADHVLDPALAQERPRHAPEGGAVVRHQACAEQEAREDARGPAKVREGCALARERWADAVGVGVRR